MSTVPRHVAVLHYLMNALSYLLKRRGRPFGLNMDIGLHFVDADGRAQRCEPDLIIMPFPNTGHGSLRRWDMPCPPDCVIEVASPSTKDNDLGFKKAWYAWMGVREYWVLDPIDSDDPAHFATGLLLPDGPLMGWRLVRGRYEPLETFWDEAARSWSAHSPILDCGLLLLEALHRQEADGGYRIVDPETGEPLASVSEKDDLLEAKDAQLAEKEKAIREAVTAMAQLRYGSSAANQLRLMMQRISTPMPAVEVVQDWMSTPSSEEFLDLARRYFGQFTSNHGSP